MKNEKSCSEENTKEIMSVTHGFSQPSAEARNRDGIIPAETLPVTTKGDTCRLLEWGSIKTAQAQPYSAEFI